MPTNYKNIKLNLGSGNKRIPGFINLDIFPLENVDIVCNIKNGIPLEDNSVNEILADDFIEHIEDTVGLFKEIYRICKPNAIIKIKVPYFKSTGAFRDPTHKSFFSEKTFRYFNTEEIKKYNLPTYCPEINFDILKINYIYSFRGARFIPFISFLKRHFWNIVRKMYIELKVIK